MTLYIYLSMVAWFHAHNLDGMAHWMRAQAHEEMIHAMKFFDHIIERGGTVELLDLKQHKTTPSRSAPGSTTSRSRRSRTPRRRSPTSKWSARTARAC